MNNVEVVGMFMVENGHVLPVKKQYSYVSAIRQVYEVLRVIEGKPLFWEEHFSRLVSSVKIAGIQVDLSADGFKEQLNKLIDVNRIKEGNIRIDLFQYEKNTSLRFALIPHKYPSVSDYKNGVVVELLHAERSNPQAKIVQQQLRDNVNKLIAEQHVYEALLVDHNGLVREGSRSNVFFIKDDVFYTPLASQVLLGITRKKVLDCIAALNMECVEAEIDLKLLAEYDAAFLTGTSPKVLPISQIGSVSFNVNNNSLTKLRMAFDQCMADYLRL